MTLLEAASAALAQGNWRAARDHFSELLELGDDAAACEGLAQAAWWLDDADATLAARGRAYRLYRDAGDQLGAARAAGTLAWDSLLFGVGSTIALGWLGRARTLLERLPEAVEHGWLAVREAEFELHVHQDPDCALLAAERATDLGRRFGDADLELVGIALEGLAMTATGDVEAGMGRLDEAVAAATGGDVRDLMWMGKICCYLISACHDARDLGRAAEWCREVSSICAGRGLAPLFAVCRTQYAAVLVAQGDWKDAELELSDVLYRMKGSKRLSLGEAVVQLGELRRRQGRLDEADDLFAQSEFHDLAVVGRAYVRLSRGDAEGAWSAIRAQLRRIPATDRLARTRTLDIGVRAALAAGDRGAASSLAGELRGTAEAVATDPLLAAAAFADGLLAGAPGDIAHFQEALRRFTGSGLRHDAALARLELARATAADGDVVSAREHVAVAVAELAELEAVADLRRARRLAAKLGAAGSSPLTPRELDVLRLIAEGLSNADVARRLVISEHTVHRHVADILRKLGQPSRAAAVARAAAIELL